MSTVRGLLGWLGVLVTLWLMLSVYLGWLTFDDGYIAGVVLLLCLVNQICLAIYGLNSFYLIWLSLKSPPVRDTTKFKNLDRDAWPKVTIQLPIYNERFVIVRLLEQVVKIKWPLDKLEVQVLDDSTDGTDKIVADAIQELKKKSDVRVTHVTRDNRIGYKAGALAAGTAVCEGEYLAIFDADFMPDSNFLLKTIPVIASNDKLGCVQARWGHLNYDYSLFTRLQAIGHDGHFIIEQYAKDCAGLLFNFNGTAGVWRRSCIADAGGWSGDTLAEDLDLSYRAQLKGWNFAYLRDVEVKAEVPLSISAFKKQQFRWAKGSMQTALKMVEPVWASNRISMHLKIESLIHLFAYSVHPMMVLNLIFTIVIFFLVPPRETDYFLWVTAVIAVGPPLVVALSQTNLDHPERLVLLPLIAILHHGLCISNTAAVLQAFWGSKSAFERTPKFGELQQDGKWQDSSYARSLVAKNFPKLEFTVFCTLLVCMAAGRFMNVNSYTYPWLMFFTLGFAYVLFLHYQEYEGALAAHRKWGDAQKTDTLTSSAAAAEADEISNSNIVKPKVVKRRKPRKD